MSEGTRKLAAIMFTDIVGYTALSQRNEKLALQLLERHRALMRPIFLRHKGREVKTIGDAFMVQFESALEAMECAVEMQEVVHNQSDSSPDKLQMKIGIHVGDVVQSDTDIHGDAVNIASRIEPLAKGGEICISEQVYDQVRNKVPFKLVKLDPHELKNVAVQIDVYKVELPWEDPTMSSRVVLPAGRIAVLPFVSMSPDPNDEFFADGLTEELIGKISQIRGLEVIARTSVMSFKKKDKMVSEIAKQLSVGTVVEGSVRKAGNRIRVTVQVIDANTEAHLFSNNYDSNLDDIFAVQSDIAEKVAGSIPGTVLRSPGAAKEEKETEDTTAYTEFLQASQLVDQDEEGPMRRALVLFEDAVKRDPQFARAFAGMAECYTRLGNGGYMQWQEAIDKGRTAAMKALEINPDLAIAHCVHAQIMFMADDSLDSRRAELQRALELNPNLAEAAWQEAQEAGVAGDVQGMVKATERAYLLDPLSPATVRLLGIYYLYAGRAEEALEHWKKTLHLNRYGTYRAMFDYHASRGDYGEAEKDLKELERLGPTLEYTYLNKGLLAALTGDGKTAHEMIEKLDSTHAPGWARSLSAGYIYLALGDSDKFFEYMFRAADDHTLAVTTLRFNPLLKKARSDPRFPEIFKRAGLPA